MILKRIDIQGFKSFPDKISLSFNQGITAVVGPNGSGKSNISDAVRWVLGEQSVKSLRGGKMEDIIFAGTENRRALGFAEVILVVDNTDKRIPVAFEEVMVSRRVFRSGESEFSINGVGCRLKDIHELFMDTGIGREGYSIIGQGRIEEILSTKSEDRRLLFEEATGIMKYKTRRQEAETKLEKERQNLLRIDDIVTELTAQERPLFRESEKAKRFLELRDQIKALQINIFIQETNRFEEQERELATRLTIVTEQLAEEQRLQKVLANEILLGKQRLDDMDKQIQQINATQADIRSETENKINRITLVEEQISHITIENTRIGKEIEKKQGWLKQALAEKTVEESKRNGLQLRFSTVSDLLELRQKDLAVHSEELSEREQIVNTANADIIETMKDMAEVKGNLQRTSLFYEQLEQRKEQLLAEKQYCESRIREKLTKINALEIRAKDLTDQEAAKGERIQLLQTRTENLESELTAQRIQLDQCNRLISESTSRREILLELKKDYEGYNKSVKSVLRQKERSPFIFAGICGVVGELMKVPEKFEIALEIALGGAVQNIITETETDAKKAIEYLKKSSQGRATFLPLSAVRSKEIGHIRSSMEKEPGFLGIAKEFVSYDAKYDAIFSNLLGKVVVMESIEYAIAFFKKYEYAYRIITLQGDLLVPGGAITGGSLHKKAANLFSRSRELHELELRIREAESEKNRLTTVLTSLMEELTEDNRLLEEAKKNRHDLLLQKASIEQEIKQQQEELNGFRGKQNELEIEDSQLMEQLSICREDAQKYEKELDKSEKRIETLQAKLDAHQNAILLDKERREAQIAELMGLKTEYSALEQNLSSVQENINRVIREIKVAESEIVNFGTEIEIKSQEKTEKEKSIVTIQNEIEVLKRIQEEQKQQMIGKEGLKNKWLEKNESLASKEREAIETLAKLNGEQVRLEMRIEQLEGNKRRLFDQIWEEYNITYQTALLEKRLAYPLSQMQREEKQVKEEIQQLGEISISSIESYKILKQRLDFLIEQREDIIKAEEKLKEIIKDLASRMEEQFREQFAIISENFSFVFKEIFGGGKAFLKLADETNILESGIDIIAQPPGKNLQSMLLLSGGERALTAIVLLFAILRMKPSPFCILDEIEASLDDANVMRYAEYLKNLSSETQFILITHRKGTMETADVLYGVTMQEQGVSKLVSVNFTETDDVVIRRSNNRD